MAEKNTNESLLFTHRLNGSNFKLWNLQIKAFLRGHGLLDVVTGAAPEPVDPTETAELEKWALRDGKAMSILISSINPEQANHVLNCESSKQVYDKIQSLHKTISEVRIMNLYEEYFSLKMGDDESVATYFSRCSMLASEIEDQGEKLTENIKMVRIISSLTPKFKNFRTVWYSIKEGRELENLLPRLRLEEDQLKKADNDEVTEAAFHVKSKGSGRKEKMSIDELKKNTKCNHCKEKGHWRRECPKRKESGHKQADGSADKKKTGEMAFSAVISDVVSAKYNDVWLADSGASKHMTSRKEWFDELKMIEDGSYVTIANDERLTIRGYGTIHMNAWCNDEWHSLRLENVQYVPGLKQNLFSTASTTAKGFTMTIYGDHCEINDCNGEARAFGFKDARNQFRMAFRMQMDESAFNCSANSVSLQQWHRRLGHINVAAIKGMCKNGIVEGIDFSDEKDFFCEECQYGKMKRSSHPSKEIRNAENGQYIHADLCGPMEELGIGGVRYFLLIKDEASSFRYVYLIESKAQVGEIFKNFLPLVKNVTGNNVKHLRCDNGREFVNKEMMKLLSENGVVFEQITAYTPEQNGFIERDNRTIQESARTMLIASGLEKNLWPEAVRTAVYMLNRSCNSRNPKTTPFGLWFGKKPNLSHVKVFGTIGYAHVPKQTDRKKWDPKARKVHLVGYEATSKNFRLYDTESKKVFISCDVKFNEGVVHDEYVQIWKATDGVDGDDATTGAVENAPDSREADDNVRENEVTPESNDDASNETTRSNARYALRTTVRPPQRYAESGYSAVIDEPITYSDAMGSKDSDKWLAAIDDELGSLERNNTWRVVDRPKGRNVVGCKWVFKLKLKPNEEHSTKYKARLVAKGYSQHAGIDYGETFSPVVRYDSVRTMFALAAAEDFEMLQFDVKTAFLNGDLEEEIFMELPEGTDGAKSGKVCRLSKSLYGLKQASRAWNTKFAGFLRDCGLTQSHADNCVFSGLINGDKVFLLLYVDDGMIMSNSMKTLNAMMDKLENAFEMTRGDPDFYVGMEIKRDRLAKTISIGQAAYITRVIEKFNMTDATPVSTPADVNVMLTKAEEETDTIFPFRQAVGSLMYAATVARPDISYAVGEVSRFLERPSSSHVVAVKRIMRYLKGTVDNGIVYGGEHNGSFNLDGYTDADFARDIESRRSTTGYAFMMNGGAVTWRSQRQKTVALSTTEAEYMAACEGAKEGVWLRQLLDDVGYRRDFPTPINMDNQSAIRLVKNPELHHRTKHIDIRLHFIRGLYESGTISIEYVPTEKQLADVFTKPLSSRIFNLNRSGLGMREIKQ